MKVKINRSKFLEGLKKVQNIVGNKGTVQILQNVKIEAKDNILLLTTTDLDISICTTIPCEIEEGGETTLPVKILFNTVAKLAEGLIEFEVDALDRAVLSAGSATFKHTGLPVKDFPALPADSDAFAYVLPQLVLREMFRKTAYAASQDETRKTLRGVLMSFKDGKLTTVATDGRRLALVEHEVDFPPDAEKDIVLPQKVVGELLRSLSTDGEVRVTIEKSLISFSYDSTRIYSKLLDEIYPNYRQVIPTECSERVIIERKLLLDALDRVSVMGMEESSSTRLVFDSNQLTITSAAIEKGSEARDIVPIKYNGPRIETVFNPVYLMEPLKAIDEDEIFIEMNNGTTPALMKCSIPFLYVMMPLRV